MLSERRKSNSNIWEIPVFTGENSEIWFWPTSLWLEENWRVNMLFGMSEWEISEPPPPKGRAEGEQDTSQQHHLQGSARIPGRLLLSPPTEAAAVPEQWLPSSFSPGSLPWFTKAQEQGTESWEQGKLLMALEPKSTSLSLACPRDRRGKPDSCKGTNSCNPLTCPLKAATSHQYI